MSVRRRQMAEAVPNRRNPLWRRLCRNRIKRAHRRWPPLVGVDEFMRNVDRYEKAARVQGVVSAADADQGVLALIDAGEFQACQRTTCAKLALPVRWSKDMPGVAETVVVTGSVQGSAGSRIFVASRLERGALEQQRDK